MNDELFMMRPRRRSSGWRLLGWTALAGVCFYGIDRVWTGSPMTPLLAVCWLMALSLRNSPRRVTAALVILFGVVVASLYEQEWDRLVIRTASYVAGGALAVMYARSRERAEQLVTHLRTVVGKMPAATVTVDAMGCILSASDELRELAGEDFQPLEGHSFPDVLLGQLPPGEAMRRYIGWFYEDGVRDEKFSLRGRHDGEISGRVICSGRGADRVLIAVLADDEVRRRLEERNGGAA